MGTLYDIGRGEAVLFNPGGKFHGWCFVKHADGYYVSHGRLPEIPEPWGPEGLVPANPTPAAAEARATKATEAQVEAGARAEGAYRKQEPDWHDYIGTARRIINAALSLPPPEAKETAASQRRAWILIRDPNCVPVRKGPFQESELAGFLREAMKHRPHSFLEVVRASSDIAVEDGPECLQVLDGRSVAVARRHIERLRQTLSEAKDGAAPRRYISGDGPLAIGPAPGFETGGAAPSPETGTYEGSFWDANNQSCKGGDRVQYQHGHRFGRLGNVYHDGDADVRFEDTGKWETVKFVRLCKVPEAAAPAAPSPDLAALEELNARLVKSGEGGAVVFQYADRERFVRVLHDAIRHLKAQPNAGPSADGGKAT